MGKTLETPQRQGLAESNFVTWRFAEGQTRENSLKVEQTRLRLLQLEVESARMKADHERLVSKGDSTITLTVSELS